MPKAAFNRSRITNGKPLTRGRATADGRRLADIYDALCAERGGVEGMPMAVQAACRATAALMLRAEQLSASMAAGAPVTSAEIVRVTSALVRARKALGDPPAKRPAVKGRVVAILPGAGAPSPLEKEPSP